MAEILNHSQAWQERASLIGEEVVSHWQQIPGGYLINPWRAWLRFTGGHTGDMLSAEPVSVGFIQEQARASLEHDEVFEEYRKKFGWNDEHQLDGPMNPYSGFLQEEASRIVEYCRTSTFPSFAEEPLGITLEFSIKYWNATEQTDPFNHDVVPHQDWVRHDVPVAIVLASTSYDPHDVDKQPDRQYSTRLWNGNYTYKGDLINGEGYIIDYLDAVHDMEQVGDGEDASRSYWVADARRGLHGRPIMQPDDSPVIRLFMRGFVAPVGRD